MHRGQESGSDIALTQEARCDPGREDGLESEELRSDLGDYGHETTRATRQNAELCLKCLS